MSERLLPDDLAHWPDDPYEMLGVFFGVTPRELRRAYHRLIRIYKPEQFPEHFRRIREAYEQLLRIAELFAPQTEAVDTTPDEEPRIEPAPKELSSTDAASWTAGHPQPAKETSEEELISPQTQRPEEEVEELWKAAIGGRPAAAYERLVQRTQQFAGQAELYQRLYWLLTLWPDLDTRRVPADWLVQGMLATGLVGSLRELYREQVADDPAEALSERYEQMLGSPVAASLRADLFTWRFQAAFRLGRWDVLHKDLPRLQQSFGLGEEGLWLRLVFTLADNAAFAGDPEAGGLLAACREEIARHEHLASSMSHFFDRFDLLATASVGWLTLATHSRVPAPFLRILAASWTRPHPETQASLMEILDWITETPGIWLDHLDMVHKCAPAALALFGELLDRFEETQQGNEERRDADAQSGFALAFLAHLDSTDYQDERYRLLLFCVREHISPEQLAAAAGGAWETALMADWPLRYVCRACRLFWS